MTDPTDKRPREGPKAAQAFADYLALGPGRSLDKLSDVYISRSESGPTRFLSQLKAWSSAHGWQNRLVAIAEAQAAEAAELRRGIYMRATREYDRRTSDDMIQAMPLDSIHGVYDRVKPDTASANSAASGGPIVIVIGVRQDGPS